MPPRQIRHFATPTPIAYAAFRHFRHAERTSCASCCFDAMPDFFADAATAFVRRRRLSDSFLSFSPRHYAISFHADADNADFLFLLHFLSVPTPVAAADLRRFEPCQALAPPLVCRRLMPMRRRSGQFALVFSRMSPALPPLPLTPPIRRLFRRFRRFSCDIATGFAIALRFSTLSLRCLFAMALCAFEALPPD